MSFGTNVFANDLKKETLPPSKSFPRKLFSSLFTTFGLKPDCLSFNADVEAILSFRFCGSVQQHLTTYFLFLVFQI